MSRRQEIRVPDIGDFESVDVVEVLVAPGAEIRKDDPLLTLESDKATMDVPSPVAGRVAEVRVERGAKVKQGDVIAVVEVAEEEKVAAEPSVARPGVGGPSPGAGIAIDQKESGLASPASRGGAPDARPGTPEEAGATPAAATQVPLSRKAGEGPGVRAAPIDEDAFRRAYASPAVRAFARELGVDLGKVRGSGRSGRILREDVTAWVKATVAAAAAPRGGFALPAMPRVDFAKFGEIERRPLTRIQRIAGPNLQRSWLHVPHVTQFDEADITELEAFRKESAARAQEQGFKLTLLAFLMKACVPALREYPTVNSSLDPDDPEQLVLKKYVHIGVAVDTEEGLVVPVVRDVDQKGVFDLAQELGEVSAQARARKLKPDQLRGASFTISSLGGVGGTAFTPIVNAPEVAILGVSRAAMRPVWRDGAFVPRLMLPLSFSYDHRVIDGATAARFTTYLAGVLADIRRVLL